MRIRFKNFGRFDATVNSSKALRAGVKLAPIGLNVNDSSAFNFEFELDGDNFSKLLDIIETSSYKILEWGKTHQEIL